MQLNQIVAFLNQVQNIISQTQCFLYNISGWFGCAEHSPERFYSDRASFCDRCDWRARCNLDTSDLSLPVNWPEQSKSWAIPNYKIEKPAQTVAFADCTDWLLKTVEGYSEADEEANGYNSGGYLAFRHNGRANVVNFDSSVNSYTQEEALSEKVLQHFTASHN